MPGPRHCCNEERAARIYPDERYERVRQALSEIYPGATPDHVLVTNGTAEANFVLAQTLLGPGARILFQIPNYLQLFGLALNLGAEVSVFSLRQDRGWEPDWDEFERTLARGARLVYISNPNNPTGYVMSERNMRRVVDAVEAAGAYVIADEIYQGAEWSGQVSPSFWGMSECVIATSGLSKAYGIPGARIGWIVGPPAVVQDCWARHDYTTIAAGTLSDLIARFAIRPEVRLEVFDRGRRFLGANKEIFRGWVESFGGFLEYKEPAAGAYAFVKYHADIPSIELAARIRERHSVLIVPGSWMGMDGYFRIGLGGPRDTFERGLALVKIELDRLRACAQTIG